MTYGEIIQIANKAFGEDSIADAISQGDECGDTLALFIVRELKDTYDEKATDVQQRNEVIRCLELAQRNLDDVIRAFETY
jgi:hypothetical protein